MKLLLLAIGCLGCANPKAPPSSAGEPQRSAEEVGETTAPPATMRRSIRGRITAKSDGAGISEKRVVAWRHDKSCWSEATTDSDGLFEFHNLPTGHYNLSTQTNSGTQVGDVNLADGDGEIAFVQDRGEKRQLVSRPPIIPTGPRCEQLPDDSP